MLEIPLKNSKPDFDHRVKVLKGDVIPESALMVELLIDFYHKMGYHLLPDLEFYLNFSSLNTVSRVGRDTAILSRGERYWARKILQGAET